MEFISSDKINTEELRDLINTDLLALSTNHSELLYPLCALLDEKITQVLHEEWSQFPLQMEYFDEYKAGENFYHKLDVLIKQKSPDTKTLSGYYSCLLLGYHGKYLDTQHRELRRLISVLRDHLKSIVKFDDLSAPKNLNNKNLNQKKLSYTRISYFFLGSLVSCWMIFKLLSWYQLSQALEQIHIVSMISL